MDTRLKLFAHPFERWPALLIAAALTLLLFAAINAGFTVHGSDVTNRVSAQSIA
jgi:hypothetical protein